MFGIPNPLAGMGGVGGGLASALLGRHLSLNAGPQMGNVHEAAPMGAAQQIAQRMLPPQAQGTPQGVPFGGQPPAPPQVAQGMWSRSSAPRQSGSDKKPEFAGQKQPQPEAVPKPPMTPFQQQVMNGGTPASKMPQPAPMGAPAMGAPTQPPASPQSPLFNTLMGRI